MEKDLEENICAESVFARIYEKYASGLHDFLYYKYGSQFNPNDTVQEAFIKLWNNCSKVTLSKAKSYLYTISNNMVLNEIKHQKVVLKHQNQKSSAHTNESPEFLMQHDEYLDRYKKVLEKLSEEQRTAFLLNKVEGKKHQEIAEILGVTRKVVEYRIYTAFNILKKELEGFYIK